MFEHVIGDMNRILTHFNLFCFRCAYNRLVSHCCSHPLCMSVCFYFYFALTYFEYFVYFATKFVTVFEIWFRNIMYTIHIGAFAPPWGIFTKSFSSKNVNMITTSHYLTENVTTAQAVLISFRFDDDIHVCARKFCFFSLSLTHTQLYFFQLPKGKPNIFWYAHSLRYVFFFCCCYCLSLKKDYCYYSTTLVRFCLYQLVFGCWKWCKRMSQGMF